MSKFLITIIVCAALCQNFINGAKKRPPCPIYDSQNIETGLAFKNGSVLHDGVLYPAKLQFWYVPDDYDPGTGSTGSETNVTGSETGGTGLMNSETGVNEQYGLKVLGKENLDANLTVYRGLIENNATATQIPDRPHRRGCLCKLRTCIRKCCPMGMTRIGKVCAERPDAPPFAPKIHDTPSVGAELVPLDLRVFGVLFENHCPNGSRFSLEPDSYDADAYYLLKNGSLWMPNYYGDKKFHFHHDYCLDNYLPSNASTTYKEVALMCLEGIVPQDESKQILFNVYPYGMIVSIVFLSATFLVYLVLPELHTLHGKALMHYVGALAVAYVFLAVIQIKGKNVRNDTECMSYALITYFAFILSFFWLNVMSFDIWWAFSGFGGFRGGVREAERKKFLCYLLYAWGCAVVVFGAVAALHYHPAVPLRYGPGFGDTSCWLQDSAVFPYFYLPMLVLVAANIVLFSATAYQIYSVKRDIKSFNDSKTKHSNKMEDDKQRFWLYVKLFLVMGVNWITEIISWAVGGPIWLWITTDVLNSIQGLLIFLIFVWKPKIRKLLVRRYYTCQGKTPPPGTSTTRSTMSSSGATTQMSMVNNGTEKALLA